MVPPPPPNRHTSTRWRAGSTDEVTAAREKGSAGLGTDRRWKMRHASIDARVE